MYFSQTVSGAIHRLASFFYQMKKEALPPKHPGELLMPSGTGIMAFHLHGRYQVEALPFFKGLLPKNYLIGQQTVSYRLKVREVDADIFGIALQPTSIWRLTGIPAHQFTNMPIEPQVIFSRKQLDLIPKLDEPIGFEERCRRATDFLEKIQSDLNQGKTLVDYALELIFESKGCISTRTLCKELHVSERHLQHLFRQQVGVSPLQYARITRFNAIFVEFTQTEAPRDLGFLTSFYNYYDASHFFKDFKAFCGEAPSQFHLEKFGLLKELVEKSPYLIQVREGK
ncbi:helix-turn-helix domain-containing protein [Algoriphagus sp. AK58]|uniref:AraC family transcriptional regulator n=1 Tax=Algoriphagus sp. AK58 TaxID=1406877 RepID=UPI001650CBAF|nr:helix-turn-helix domain-containing protein [Algoriphagus sp. AK58]MBC6367058.1 hypothetical protein [Algoriphagus sp. AK58]